MGNLTHTVSGDIASFRSAARVPIESLKCYFEPIQEGSGDPSPKNVRPITGWQGINVYLNNTNSLNGNQITIPVTFPALGKNLLDKNEYSEIMDTLISFGGVHDDSLPDGSFVLAAGTYTFSTNHTMTMINIVNNQKLNISTTMNTTTNTFTITEQLPIRILILDNNSSAAEMSFYNYQLEAGDTATVYEPFNNTVYGGYVDIVKGELVKEWEHVQLNDSTKWQQVNRMFVYGDIYDRKIETDAMLSMMGNIINSCAGDYNEDADIYAKWNSTTEGHPIIQYKSTVINPPTLENIQLLSANGDIEICYKLATPIIYSLTSTQLKTLLNQNHIWSNTNNITEVSYAVHDSALIQAAKKQIIANEPHIEIANAATANFKTDMIAPIKTAIATFIPVLEGSGDPSPTNIRNIKSTSYIAFNLYGANLCEEYPPIIRNGYYRNTQGEEIAYSDLSYIATMYPIGYPYTIGLNNFTSSYYRAYFLDSSGNIISKSGYYSTPVKSLQMTRISELPENCRQIQLLFSSDSDISNLKIYKIKDTIVLSASNNLGTFYGGYINLITGELISTYNKITLSGTSNESWAFFLTSGNNPNRVYLDISTISNLLPISINNTTYADIYCNYLTANSDNLEYATSLNTINNMILIGVPKSLITSAAAWKTYLNDNPLDIIYSTLPITYLLTPQSLQSLRGENNINIYGAIPMTTEVQYYTH